MNDETGVLGPWQPPTVENLYQSFQSSWDLIPAYQDLDSNFPFLYDWQVAEEGELYEVLPGLFGKVSGYYVAYPEPHCSRSQVWINNRAFLTWLKTQVREEVLQIGARVLVIDHIPSRMGTGTIADMDSSGVPYYVDFDTPHNGVVSKWYEGTTLVPLGRGAQE